MSASETPVPVRKIPMGVRALPVAQPPKRDARFAAETCGKGEKVPRHRHLDEIDGDTFK